MGVNAAGQDTAAQMIQQVFNEGTGNVETITTPAGASATTQVSDPSLFSTSALTLSGATPVVRLPAPVVGKVKRVYLIQDATGSRIVTWATASGAIKWAGSAAPTLSTAAGKIDRATFECFDGTNWIGTATLNIG